MSEQVLRSQIVELLNGGHAHADYSGALQSFPFDKAGARVGSIRHTAWQILEHLRISQWDITEFSKGPGHVSPEFPDGYWPKTDTPPDEATWKRSIAEFLAHLKGMQDLVADSSSDLYTPFPHGDGQTLLREALISMDHSSYHLGQILLIHRGLEPS
jgi:hypothetical protein